VIRSCEPFKIWWAPTNATISPERLKLVIKFCTQIGCQVPAYGGRITLKRARLGSRDFINFAAPVAGAYLWNG